MGLCNFPSPSEGLLHVLVMSTVLSVALLKNMVRSVLQVVGINGSPPNSEADQSNEHYPAPAPMSDNGRRARRVSTTRFSNCCGSGSDSGIYGNMWCAMECCVVCLCGFEGDEEVSELPCKHFFHKGCLDKWFENQHSTCPLCRSSI